MSSAACQYACCQGQVRLLFGIQPCPNRAPTVGGPWNSTSWGLATVGLGPLNCAQKETSKRWTHISLECNSSVEATLRGAAGDEVVCCWEDEEL